MGFINYLISKYVQDEVSNPEYPDQQNDSDNNPGNISQAVSNTTDDPEVSQSHNDNPEEPNYAGYPETLDISTGTTQNSDPSTHSVMGQEGTFMPHEETLTPEKGHPGSEKATQGRRKPGGTKDDYVGTIPHAPFLDEFLRKKTHHGSLRG